MDWYWRAVAGFWLAHALWVTIALLSLRRLQGQAAGDVTVVIAARDEAERIGETVRRLRPLRVLVAEGQSQDATRDVAAAAGATIVDASPRDGWVGKVAALDAAMEHVQTEWVCFVDADVQVAPGTVQRAIAAAERDAADLLVLYPGQRCDTVAGRAVHHAIGQGILVLSPPWLVRRDIGVAGLGHFMLVRRSRLQAAGGHAAIKDEILDDVAMGRLIRRAGGRTTMASGTDDAESDWARSATGVLRAMEKNAFAGLGYSVLATITMTAGYAIMIGSAVIGWTMGPSGVLTTAAWGLMMVPSALQQIGRRGWGPASRAGRPEAWWRRALAVALSPLAWSLFIILPWWSMWRTRHGIQWRGATYAGRR